MSRTVFIMIMLLLVVSSGIIVTLGKGSSEVSEKIAYNVYSSRAGNLGAYAIQWAIKKVTDGTVTDDLIKEFGDFNVLNGKINKVEWDFDWNGHLDTINIIANVCWIEGGESVNHQSSAMILRKATECTTIENAATAATNLVVNPNDPEDPNYPIIGDYEEGVTVDFKEIFGVTKEEMRARATHVYNNPTNPTFVDGITWIEGNVNFNYPTNKMSGILIATTGITMKGVEFDGIIYADGVINIHNNCKINGSIIGEKIVHINGNDGITKVTYDPDIINSVFSDYITGGTIKIITWRE